MSRTMYHGKPSIAGLKTIDPKIVINRSPTGVTPMAVMVSACETICNTGDPYGDLHYEWNFGDSAGTETFVDQYSGKIVNANSDQQGPEACYIYRNSGEFTISLTAKGKDENGNLVTATTTTLTQLGCHYIHLGGATGGTFDLIFNGEIAANIPWSATDPVVESALLALPSLDSTNCRLLKPLGRVVEFFGPLSGKPYSFTADFAKLTGVLGIPLIRVERASGTHASVVASEDDLTTNYFDSKYTGIPNGTQTQPWNTWAQLAKFCIGGSKRKLVIADGSDITMTSKLKFNLGQRTTRIVRSGGGLKPIIRSADYHFEWEVTYGDKANPDINGGDFVISGIDIISTGIATSFLKGYASSNGTNHYPYGKYVDFLIDNCDWKSVGVVSDQGFCSFVPGTKGGQFLAHHCFWNCNFNQGTANHSTVFVGGEQWLSIVGCAFSKGEGSLVFDHYIYSNNLGHQCHRWNSFKSGKKSFCLNLNAQNTAGAVRHLLVDGCDITGLQNGIDLSNSNNNPTLSGYFDDVVIQYNKIHSDQISDQQLGIYSTTLAKITVRNCYFWDNYSSGISNSDSIHPTVMSLYNCCFYDSIISIVGNQTGYIHNNDFHITSAVSAALRFRGSDSSVRTWDCDKNTWYAPDVESPFYDRDAGKYVSWAAWQSLGKDLNGANVDPKFTDPANGVLTKIVPKPNSYTFSINISLRVNENPTSVDIIDINVIPILNQES